VGGDGSGAGGGSSLMLSLRAHCRHVQAGVGDMLPLNGSLTLLVVTVVAQDTAPPPYPAQSTLGM
jgi:hypothetical protein